MGTIFRPPYISGVLPKDSGPAIRAQGDVHSPSLLGQDKFFGLAGHPNYDWPVPPGYAPGVVTNRTIALGLIPILIGKDFFFGLAGNPQFDWPVPPGYPPGVITNRTLLGQNLLPQVPSQPTVVRGPLIVNPRGYDPGVVTNRFLNGQFLPNEPTDFFFGLAGNPNHDWPVPPGAPPGVITNRTWVQSQVPDLVGKDFFFGLAGNPNYDWPVPKGPTAAIDLRFFAAGFRNEGVALPPHPPENYDWPVPPGYPQGCISNKTWIQTLLPYEFGKDIFFGLPGNPNFDWPNPRGYIPSIDLRTWINQGLPYDLPPAPPTNYDWPNPRGPFWPDDGWPTKNFALNQDVFYGLAGSPNYDWPNPRGPEIGTVTNRTWIQGGNIITAPGIPFYNFDFPNPRGTIPSIDLRTWIDQALDFEVSFPPPPSNKDWPNPRGALNNVNHISWGWWRALSLQDTFFGLAGHPTFDWPNPTILPPNIGIRTWTNGFRIQNQPSLIPPMATNYDWPVPRGPIPVIDLKTYLNTLALILPPGPPPPPPAPTILPGGGHRKKRGRAERPIWDRPDEAPKPKVEPPKKVELPPSFLGKTLLPIKKVVAAPPAFHDVGYADPMKVKSQIDQAHEEQDRQDAMAAILAIMKNNKG